MVKKTASEISNSQSLRVLMVEDSEDDALLIIRELKKGGYDPVYERVETAAAMKKALKNKQWDIILCDYKLPKFNAPSAIALLKETNIDIPLIIVSGAIGEDMAIECMRSGANDYIMKNNLSRLCPAIAREAGEADSRSKRKQADNALRESEERYRALFDRSLDLVYIHDFEGRFIDANAATLNRLGYTKEEIHSLNFASLISEDQLPLAIKTLQEILETGIQKNLTEFHVLHKDGTHVYVETQGSSITSNGTPVAIQSIARDITERKKQEEVLQRSEEKYRTILESIEEGYYELDINGNFTFFNNSTCRILGYPQEEMMGMNSRQYTDKENAKKLFKTFNEVYRTGEPVQGFDWQIIRKDGTKRYIESSVSLQKDPSGKPIGFSGITRDVTERKQAEVALQKSEAIYRLVVENINDIIWTFDLSSMTYTFVSPSARRILGYSDETIMKNLDLVFTPETKQHVMNAFGKFTQGKAQGNILVIDAEHRKKDGSLVWMEISASPLKDDLGNIVGFLGVTRNITERRQAEEALRESERKHKSLIDNFQDVIFTINLEGKITFASKSTKERLGYESAETINMNILDFVPEEDRQRGMESLQKGMKGEKITGFQTQVITKSGEILFFECFFSRVYEDGAVVGAQAVIKDITDRKQAEEALRKSEVNYKHLFDNSPTAIYQIDFRTGKFLKANDVICEYFGCSQEEITLLSPYDLLTKESQKVFLERLNKMAAGDKMPENPEYEFVDKNGKRRWLKLNSKNIYDSEGLAGADVVAHDITERKQAEEELQQILERLRKAFGATVQVMVSAVEARDPYTAGHQIRTANLARAIATEMGLTQDKIEGIRMAGSIHDIGKLSIPAEILTKPTKLTELEFSMIKEHAQKGYEMLKDVESPWPLAQIVYQHHERMNGSGYPRNLKGGEILIEARIMAVADVVEAMASYRPYRPALGIETALEEIEKNRGMLYDADAVDACLKLFREKGFQLERI